MFDPLRIANCVVAHPRHSDDYGCGSLLTLGARMRVSAFTQTYGLSYSPFAAGMVNKIWTT